MPTVTIAPPYRGPTRGKARISVEGETFRECLDAIETEFPGFAALVYGEAGDLNRYLKLFRNGEPIEKDALDAPVAESDEIALVAAISGG